MDSITGIGRMHWQAGIMQGQTEVMGGQDPWVHGEDRCLGRISHGPPVKIIDNTKLTDCLSLWKRALINSKVAT